MSRLLSTSLVMMSLAGALVLAGCSGGEPTADVTPTEQATVTTDSPTPTVADSPASTDSTKVDDVARKAIATAVDSVPGSRAYAYDRDDRDRYIEVTVIDGSTEQVVTLAINGTSIIGTENEGSLDRSDRAEFDAATVELGDAIATAKASTPGVLREADLDDENGSLVWEIQIGDVTSPNTVRVDARSGAIVS